LARTNSIVDRSGTERGGFLSRLNQFRKRQVNGKFYEFLSPGLFVSPSFLILLSRFNIAVVAFDHRSDVSDRTPK
jgi:hypothetical protein